MTTMRIAAATAALLLLASPTFSQDRTMPAPSPATGAGAAQPGAAGGSSAIQGGGQPSAKMSGETTGSIATQGDSPKAGLDPDCKEKLANQTKQDPQHVARCGAASE